MIRALAVTDVRAAEAAAMAGLPQGELMSRAAEGLAQIAAARLVERDGRTVVALVGAGDNGGDTLYAAGLLSDTGFACAVVLLPESGRAGVHALGLKAAELAGATVLVAAEGLIGVVAKDKSGKTIFEIRHKAKGSTLEDAVENGLENIVKTLEVGK